MQSPLCITTAKRRKTRRQRTYTALREVAVFKEDREEDEPDFTVAEDTVFVTGAKEKDDHGVWWLRVMAMQQPGQEERGNLNYWVRGCTLCCPPFPDSLLLILFSWALLTLLTLLTLPTAPRSLSQIQSADDSGPLVRAKGPAKSTEQGWAAKLHDLIVQHWGPTWPDRPGS